MNVTAIDKATGKKNNITITNDIGRLSKEEIEKMVNDAKMYEEQDNIRRKQIEARNSLENYTYHMKNSLEEANFKGKFSTEEVKEISSKCDEAISWLHSNLEASADEIETRRKQLETHFNPIMQRVYQSSANSN